MKRTFRFVILFILVNTQGIFANTQEDQQPHFMEFSVGDCFVGKKWGEITPTIKLEDDRILTTFALAISGKKVFVNPAINQGRDSLTFHLDTANPQYGSSLCACEKMVELNISLHGSKYKKLYIVVDQTVWYEFEIPSNVFKGK